MTRDEQVSFRFVWGSQAIAQFAAQGIVVSIPLLAVTRLGAGATETGFITFVQYLPVLLITPFFGTLVDVLRKKPIMLLGHAGRALVFALLAFAAGFGILNIPVLLGAVLISGALSACFDVALHAYVPQVVPRDGLVKSNAKIQGTLSFAQVVGPSLGGLVAGLGSPAVGLGIFAISYAVAAILLIFARQPEGVLHHATESFWRRTAQGFTFCFASRPLRTLLVAGTWFNLFEQALITIFLVFGVKILGLAPAQIGLILALGAIGAIVGSFISARFNDRLGRRTILIISMGLASVTPLGLALMPHGTIWTQVAIVAVFFSYGLGVTSYNIQAMSYRQQLAPSDMQGRVSAVYRLFAYGALAFGGLIAGALSAFVGLQLGLTIVAIALFIGWLGFLALSKSAIEN